MVDNPNNEASSRVAATQAFVLRLQHASGLPEPPNEGITLNELQADLRRRDPRPSLSAWQDFAVIAPAGRESDNLITKRDTSASAEALDYDGNSVIRDPKLTVSVFDEASAQMGPEIPVSDIGSSGQRGLVLKDRVERVHEDVVPETSNQGLADEDNVSVESPEQPAVFDKPDLRRTRWRDFQLYDYGSEIPYDPRIHDNVSINPIATASQASVPSVKARSSIPPVVRRVLRDLACAGDTARKVARDSNCQQGYASSDLQHPHSEGVTARKIEADMVVQFQDVWQSVSRSVLPLHVAQSIMARPDGQTILNQLSFENYDSELPGSTFAPSQHTPPLRPAHSLHSEEAHLPSTDRETNSAEKKLVDDLDEIKALKAEILQNRYKTLEAKWKQRHALEAELAFSHMRQSSNLTVPMLDDAISSEDKLIASYRADLEQAEEGKENKVQARLDKLIRSHQRSVGNAIDQHIDFGRYEEEFMDLCSELK